MGPIRPIRRLPDRALCFALWTKTPSGISAVGRDGKQAHSGNQGPGSPRLSYNTGPKTRVLRRRYSLLSMIKRLVQRNLYLGNNITVGMCFKNCPGELRSECLFPGTTEVTLFQTLALWISAFEIKSGWMQGGLRFQVPLNLVPHITWPCIQSKFIFNTFYFLKEVNASLVLFF